jgi:hypothetical protein
VAENLAVTQSVFGDCDSSSQRSPTTPSLLTILVYFFEDSLTDMFKRASFDEATPKRTTRN